MMYRLPLITGWTLALLCFFLPMLHAEEAPKTGWQPELRVGLFAGQKAITFQTSRECVLSLRTNPKKNISVKKGESVTVTVSGEEFRAKGKKFSGECLELRTPDPRDMKELVTTVNGKSYRGGLQLRRRSGAITVVNILPVEQYLRGVLPEEMPPSWALDALKTQAVAARTFALKNRKRHESDGYDLCSSIHCQLYTGVAEEDPHTDAAIRETYGEVLVAIQNGGMINAPFHTDSGGMTENSEEVWGNYSSFLRGVKELEEKTHPWSKTVPLDEFQKKFSIGTIKKIELSSLKIGKKTEDRTSSGRVKKVRIVGSKGTKTVPGTEMRSMFGLKSTLFSIRLQGSRVVFSGYGWGHGLGMSQWGAKAFAERGDGYQKILAHYYQDTMIKKLY